MRKVNDAWLAFLDGLRDIGDETGHFLPVLVVERNLLVKKTLEAVGRNLLLVFQDHLAIICKLVLVSEKPPNNIHINESPVIQKQYRVDEGLNNVQRRFCSVPLSERYTVLPKSSFRYPSA